MNRREIFTLFLLIIVAITSFVSLFSGCVTPSDRSKPKAVSLEEAKKITATFEDRVFVPPKRTINDITKILSEEKPADLKSYQKAIKLADKEPPVTKKTRTLANFYNRRAQAAHEAGRAKQEIEDYRLAVKYGKKSAIPGLGTAEARGGNFSRSIRILEEYLEFDPGVVAEASLNGTLAVFYARRGDLKSAEKSLKKAEQSRDRALSRFGRHIKDVIAAKMDTTIDHSRAAVLDAVGRYADAEALYRKAIHGFEPFRTTVLKGQPDKKRSFVIYNWYLSGLSENLRRQGRLVEAEVAGRRSVRGALKSHGRYSAHTAWVLRQLIYAVFEQGRYQEAEALARAGLEIYRKTQIPRDSAAMAWTRTILADALFAQKRWNDALIAYDEIQRDLTTDPDMYALSVKKNVNLWLAYIKGNRAETALKFILPACEEKAARLGEAHYETAESRGIMAMALAATGNIHEAVDAFKKAVPILLKQQSQTRGEEDNLVVRDFRMGLILDAYIQLLSRIHETPEATLAEIDAASEAFRLSDVVRGREVKRAMAASSARAAVRDPGLADLARKEQDALTQITALNALLTNALSAAPEEKNPEIINDLRSRIRRFRSARIALMNEIETRFPDYADLIHPKPVTIEEIRSSLNPREALIATYVSDSRTFVWAIPHDGSVAFTFTAIGSEELSDIVGALRKSLDPRATTLGEIPEYDLERSYRLYEAILQPVESGWKRAKRLLVIAHGALGFIPFSVMTTGPAKLDPEKELLFSNYRNIPWLARTHHVTVLPSVTSFRTLRNLPNIDIQRRPFVGFGNPYFTTAQAESKIRSKIRSGYTGLTRGIPLERRGLKKVRIRQETPDSITIGNLTPLPDTADEVQGIAVALNADPERDVYLGRDASEDNVKTLDLSNVKVIAFATHGLLPGELDGLRQPALALSAPEVVGGKEDGILTMGEILGIKLNADWVVLSACNTGAGEGAGAEAVSGLGRAFFYAGTRALLVSNWPVETTSAKTLTTELFRLQAQNPNLSRADALNHTMLHLIDRLAFTDEQGREVFSYAHPVFWAPFSIVGDGG